MSACMALFLDLNTALGNKALSIAKCYRPSKNGYPNYPILEAILLSDHQKVEQYRLLERVVHNSLGILHSHLLLLLLLQWKQHVLGDNSQIKQLLI